LFQLLPFHPDLLFFLAIPFLLCDPSDPFFLLFLSVLWVPDLRSYQEHLACQDLQEHQPLLQGQDFLLDQVVPQVLVDLGLQEPLEDQEVQEVQCLP